MNKVYIVWENNKHEETIIRGIFTNEKKAKEVLKSILETKEQLQDFHIGEYIIGKLYKDSFYMGEW